MLISNTVKSLEDNNGIVDLSIIMKLYKILFILLIIFTKIYFTCFGCFLVLNDSTSWTAQTVTLSSEGAAKMYPHSMGEYQISGGYWSFGIWYDTYHHVQLEDRFLMYNKRGKIESHKKHLIIHLQILVGSSLVSQTT